MKRYDIVFVGHVTIDEIVAMEGSAAGAPGGAPFYGAFAAATSQKNIAVITRIAERDKYLLEPLTEAGIDVFLEPSEDTTLMRVVHPSTNVDERLMYQMKNAGFFTIEEMSDIETGLIHLGALTDQEFTLEFMRSLSNQGFRLSVDMQGFVRQVDEISRVIRFGDVLQKEEIIGLADFVKLDIVEAKILARTDNLSEAAALCESWGCKETMITSSAGVLVRAMRNEFSQQLSNRSSPGRTGRGDTTFGAYLARRIDYSVEDSLRFAAALASIKMEKVGPFRGTLNDVIERIAI